MAIKDQCANCKNCVSIGNCQHQGRIIFDGASCEQYSRGIDLIKSTISTKQSQPRQPSHSPQQSSKPKIFQHPFSFKGRIRRLEYGLSSIILFAFLFPMELMPSDTDDLGWSVFLVIWLMICIPMYWFWFAQGAKRCHDRNQSGWYQLIPFYWLWLVFGKGDDVTNNYGHSPK